MLVKCGTDRLLLNKHCRWSAYKLVLPDAYYELIGCPEASDAGASRMASTPLVESSCKHNPGLPTVEDSATELVKKSKFLPLHAPSAKASLKNCCFASLLWNLLSANIEKF